MKRLTVFAAGVTLSAICAAAPDMQPGLWAVTVSMDAGGMPSMMPPTKFQHCYRAEDLKDMRSTVPEKNPDCKVSDWKESGNTVSWKMSCGGNMPMTGSGSITYSGDSYTGVNKMTMHHGSHTMTMTQKYAAKRLGDCR